MGPRWTGAAPVAEHQRLFGFGGTNFHAVLEEYTGDYLGRGARPALNRWPAELFVWRRPSREALLSAMQTTRDALARGAAPELADLAYSLCKANPDQSELPTLAVVATSLDDLKSKLDQALTLIRSGRENSRDRAVSSSPRILGASKAIASPSCSPVKVRNIPNMLAQLAMVFPEVRREFDCG